ncbi:MAG: C45 family autoproteolytic acyltransferase/hydrolase [Woeseiaceae bacterium]|nr:C45 family autoproteolytic acyltransferase/hydrolase [Woeseiaceae bacterium]
MQLAFTAIDELSPGKKWADLFRRLWPAYRQWWLSEGELARPTYLESRKALATHMPELLPIYETLTELAGGSDQAARFLAGYCPPPYLAGCSQAVWPGSEPLLVRNYDYSPHAFDAVVLRTQWLGRKVLCMADSLIGALDGINDDGLAVSLTFGGRRIVGVGFGIPILLRYVLETCSTVDAATEVLKRIPCHMAYNVTLLDSAKHYKTLFISPDRPTNVTTSAVATNHQHEVEWADHARETASVEREVYLLKKLTQRSGSAEKFIAAFQRPPLYSLGFERGFGTLFTAAYWPRLGTLDLHWPGISWSHSIGDFEEGTRTVKYRVPQPHSATNVGT